MTAMSMLNQAAVEALCSATYLENYLDCLENLPDDLQRSITQLREIDSKYNELLRDIDQYRDAYRKEMDGLVRKRYLNHVQIALIRCQDLGDEKLQIVSQIIEHVENRSRQLDQDLENLDPTAGKDYIEKEENHPPPPITTTKVKTSTIQAVQPSTPILENNKPEKSNKRQRRHRQNQDGKDDDKKDDKDKPKKKKKRKMKKEKEGDKSPIDIPIDPDEPLYCLCQQVSYGEMIGCDNDDCQIEWFHFNCVGLTNKPKGKWYCPRCRGDKPNVRRPDIK